MTSSFTPTLSEKKLRFLCDEIKILGRVVAGNGIKMDQEKVDRILNWKVPTNRTLCKGFIGSVGYLADDIYKVHIPLGVLAEASAETRPFKWTFTEQRAFELCPRPRTHLGNDGCMWQWNWRCDCSGH